MHIPTATLADRLGGPYLQSPLQFTSYDPTTGVSLAELIPSRQNRRGIYVLHRDDGWEYVGKATDVTSRYSEHHEMWGDGLISVDFSPVPEGVDDKGLLALESQTRDWRRSMGKKLWNDQDNRETLAHPLPPIADADIADALWRAMHGSPDEVSQMPFRTAVLSGKGPAARTRSLLADRHRGIVLDVLAHIVRYALPNPAVTLGHRWKVSSPQSHGKDEPRDLRRLATIAVQNVTFVHVRRHGSGQLDVRIHLYPEHIVSPRYGFGPEDYVDMLSHSPIQRADMDPELLIEALATDRVFRAAAFSTAHRLTRRGRPTYNYRHDPAMADAVFGRITELGLDVP